MVDIDAIAQFESCNYDLIVCVTEYDPGCDAIIRMDPNDSFPPEPEEIDYALFDLQGNRLYDEDIEADDEYPEWDEVDAYILDEIRDFFTD